MISLPPPLWTLIYLVAGLVISAVGPWRSVRLTFAPAGLLFIALGVIAAFWASTIFRRAGTEIDPQSPTNRCLITTGPFRWSRNPMYLGMVLFTLGIALCHGTPPMYAVPVLVFATLNGVHIQFEEA